MLGQRGTAEALRLTWTGCHMLAQERIGANVSRTDTGLRLII
jgi:hypothetical protein